MSHSDHSVAAFLLPPGTRFADFAGDARRLGTCLACDMVSVERFRHPSMPGQAHAQVFTVSHEMRDGFGPAPHLHDGLGSEASRFAARWAVVSAFVAAGLPTPLFAGWEPMHQPGSRPVHVTDWVLCEGLTIKEVAASLDRLRQRWRCADDARISAADTRHASRRRTGSG